MGDRKDAYSILSDRVEDGVRKPGQDPLANDAKHRGSRFGMLGYMAETALHLIEEVAPKSGTSEVVKVGGFVQFKFGRFVEVELSTHVLRDRARARTS